MDPTVQVALVGVVTTALTTAGIVGVAIVNNRRERSGSAESAVEKTLRERIVLRDEQIAGLREDIADKDRVILELLADLNECKGKT